MLLLRYGTPMLCYALLYHAVQGSNHIMYMFIKKFYNVWVNIAMYFLFVCHLARQRRAPTFMMPFQLSPVETWKSVRNAMPKFSKVACRLMPSHVNSSLHTRKKGHETGRRQTHTTHIQTHTVSHHKCLGVELSHGQVIIWLHTGHHTDLGYLNPEPSLIQTETCNGSHPPTVHAQKCTHIPPL